MMMRRLDAPEARAASTNSFSRSDSTSPRTTRAVYIQNTAANTSEITDGVPPNFWMAMARITSAGTTRNRSVRRIRNWSCHLPK